MPTSPFAFPWAPRRILAGRSFRLPLQAGAADPSIDFAPFELVQQRYSGRDRAYYYYLRAPQEAGDYTLTAKQNGHEATVGIQVRTLDQMRTRHRFNGAEWPRRWGDATWTSTKQRQCLEDMPPPPADEQSAQWWLALSPAQAWAQLPPAELPRAHFVNVHQGCPACGTAIFKHGGFYPWQRNHKPCDFRSRCPACETIFPSNDLAAGDYTSGAAADDGYGHFDDDGHIYLFSATYHRDQTVAFGAGIGHLAAHLATDPDQDTARRLGLLLLRYAVETVYLAAVPQFRYGPTEGVEKAWNWGQPDWATHADPIKALYRKGSVRYCIDVPYISETLAQAYDLVWPFLPDDDQLLVQARELGLDLHNTAAAADLIEEMLACLLQAAVDAAASSNKPRVSQGALVLLRALDRPDGHQMLAWLYDAGPDRLRTFGTNHFFPDGTPFESAGGYNNIHANGLFALEHHRRALHQARPTAYPETDFPPLTADPRAARIVLAPHEIGVLGRTNFQFGDGGSGSQKPYPAESRYTPLPALTLERGLAFTGDERLRHLSFQADSPLPTQATIHDGAGVAIMRLGPDIACGVVYGDAVGHQHVDLFDVQLFAHGRPFLSDLGYPQSWATILDWESHWATHNTVWGSVADLPYDRLGGRGRLVRTLEGDGFSLIEIAAERWAQDDMGAWFRPGVTYRRLLALIAVEDGGAVLVDLSRINGGTQHWRTCRGLEGTFSTSATSSSRPGTLADPQGKRGSIPDNSIPDSQADTAALAWMDEVEEIKADVPFSGTWHSRHLPSAWMDVHQVATSASTRLYKARATQIMGSPEESAYDFSPLVWHRPVDGATTAVDLVFETRTGAAALAKVKSIAVKNTDADQPASEAAGISLQTHAGQKLRLYWNPAGGPCLFADGTRIDGAIALEKDSVLYGVGLRQWQKDDQTHHEDNASQHGKIIGLDRTKCSIDVMGLHGVTAGDRLRINPDGRGHNYAIEAVEALEEGLRLFVDVTSLLGRAQICRIEGNKVWLDAFILARSGNLRGTRLLADTGWEEIRQASNPDDISTRLVLSTTDAVFEVGAHISAVDYVVGDTVCFETVSKRRIG
jgi:hypothetical protein